jgi:hypothetical protein
MIGPSPKGGASLATALDIRAVDKGRMVILLCWVLRRRGDR